MWLISAATPVYRTFVNPLLSSCLQSSDGRTWTESDIVESELSDAGVELHQQGQWLADTTSGTEDGNLGGLSNKMISSEFHGALESLVFTCLAETVKARRWTCPNICRAKNISAVRREKEQGRVDAEKKGIENDQ